MTDREWELWQEANESHHSVSVSSPCRDCTPLFSAAMRALDECDGTPGPIGRPRLSDEPERWNGRGVKYASEAERLAARRAGWRLASARRRAVAAMA